MIAPPFFLGEKQHKSSHLLNMEEAALWMAAIVVGDDVTAGRSIDGGINVYLSMVIAKTVNLYKNN